MHSFFQRGVLIRKLALLVLFFLICHPSFSSEKGVFHRVSRGETLYGISRVYRIDMKVLAKANGISYPYIIRAGRYLFVPGGHKILKVEPMDRQMRQILQWGVSSRWKYIIIHHSATERGSLRVFDRVHREDRHFKHGAGYHFIICNGTFGKADGQLEVSRRWIKQLNGAHCRAGGMNEIGIGICVVGNFNGQRVSKKQFASLVNLVTNLSIKHNIPLANIEGHKNVKGASTECPGKNFPWKPLISALQDRGVE